jgi:hypothetical protein
MSDQDLIRQAVAQGWCHETTERTEMDVVLAEAITQSVLAALPAAPSDREARLVEALIGVTPGHRDPAGKCWCHYGHNPDYGHTVSCLTARALLAELETAK